MRWGTRSIQRYPLRVLSLLALTLLSIGGSLAPRQPAIARTTAAGKLGAGAQPDNIVLSLDGNLWFAEDRGSHGC